jgi:hypothetical protein
LPERWQCAYVPPLGLLVVDISRHRLVITITAITTTITIIMGTARLGVLVPEYWARD